MEIKNLLPAIVALLIVVSIASLSTTSVNAAASTSSSIPGNEQLVKADIPMIFHVTVTNNGTSPVDNVRIIVDNGTGFRPLSIIPADNIVACQGDNTVVLRAGTVVELTADQDIILPEGTDVIVENGDQMYVENVHSSVTVQENTIVAMRQDTSASSIPTGDNIKVTEPGVQVELLTNNQLRMLEDTLVENVGGTYVLPENTLVQLVAQNDSEISSGENVIVSQDVTVTLSDNHAILVTNNPQAFPAGSLPTGYYVQIIGEANVAAGTIVQLDGTASVSIAENENVIREAGTQLDVTGAEVMTQPENWDQTTGLTDLGYQAIEWDGVGDNIPVGGNRLFEFALTTPSTTLDNAVVNIWVKTKNMSSENYIEGPIVVTVDGKAPTFTVTAAPSLVSDNAAVTITLVASEKASMAENTVWVAENNAPEKTPISMTTTDNITWTGTYTTGDNWLRDGTASVYVIGHQIEDSVGNAGADNAMAQATFTIDREKPPTPNLSTISGLPLPITNIGTGTIQGTALDNFLNTIVNLTNGTVQIRFGSSINNATLLANGQFYYNFTITQQGKQEVGIRFIDAAGNVGNENAENIIFDSVPPVITPGTISSKPLGVASTKTLANGVLINDNTPTVTLTFNDATLGIDNSEFGSVADNTGYEVELWDNNKVEIADLTNATPPATNMPNTISFENMYPTALADGTYYIYAVAGDNLQMENMLVSFVIDTTPPAVPVLSATTSQNPLTPDVRTTTSISLGGTAEPGATVRIWISQDPFTTETNVENIVAGTDGGWLASLTLPQGVTVRVRVDQVDEAGNASLSKTTYGYLEVDASAPVVVITSPTTGTKTDKSTITVSGTVTKDPWETYQHDITLRVQNGITSTSIIIPIANDGTFSVDVPLAEGKNSIIATATDAVGNYTSYTVTVERTMTSWAVYAIILVIIALILAAIAIFRMK